MLQHDTLTIEVEDVLMLEHSKEYGARQICRAPCLTAPRWPVARLALGVGDGIDDDVIVKFFKDEGFLTAAGDLLLPCRFDVRRRVEGRSDLV